MALVPQNQSIVIVFSSLLDPPSDSRLRAAVGARSKRTVEVEGGSGWIFPDDTLVIVRAQGGGLSRIEVRDPFPGTAPDHSRARTIISKLLPPAGAKPHSIGINYDTLVIQPSERLLRQFFLEESAAGFRFDGPPRLDSLALVAPAVGSDLKVEISLATAGEGGDALPVARLKLNYSFATKTLVRVRTVVGEANLRKADRHAERLLRDLGVQE